MFWPHYSRANLLSSRHETKDLTQSPQSPQSVSSVSSQLCRKRFNPSMLLPKHRSPQPCVFHLAVLPRSARLILSSFQDVLAVRAALMQPDN